MTQPKHQTRETWLQAAVGLLTPRLQEHGGELPKPLVALTSWPSSNSKKAVGQHLSKEWAKDGKTVHVLVSPVESEPVEVLDTLAHELVHACRPGAKHGPEFKQLAQAIGLEGKMPTSHAGPDLKQHLEALAKQLGPYPHSPVQILGLRKKGGKKTCVRYVSPVNPKYSAWISVKQDEEVGGPICPISRQPMVEA